MNSCAFVTYNTVGDGVANGWHDSNGRRALVLQNSKGEQWAVSPSNVPPADLGASRVVAEIDRLWGELRKSIDSIDHIVVYVGANGSEQAIALAAQLSAEKITFVGCDCGLAFKEAMVRAAGLSRSRRLLCECGGHWTMKRLFETFMATGELQPIAA